MSYDSLFCFIYFYVGLKLLQFQNRSHKTPFGAVKKQGVYFYYAVGVLRPDTFCLPWRKRVENYASYARRAYIYLDFRLKRYSRGAFEENNLAHKRRQGGILKIL